MNMSFREAVGSITGMISLVGFAISLTLLVIFGMEKWLAFSVAMFSIGWLSSALLLWGDGILPALATWRAPLRISAAAVDIILARAQADPHLARAIGKSLRNCIKAYSGRNPGAMQALDWIVTGKTRKADWRLGGNLLSLEIEHPDFRIAQGRLHVRRALLPDTIITAIDEKRLCDLIDIPLLRRNIMIREGDIEIKPDAVILDVFRDRRDIEGVIEALEAIERSHLDESHGGIYRKPTSI